MSAALGPAALVVVALLLWPRTSREARLVPALRARPGADRAAAIPLASVARDVLGRDPVEALRARRRGSRRGGDEAARLLELLEAVGAALRAGLGPGPAVQAALAALPEDPGCGSVGELRRRLGRTAADGVPLGSVWRRWARTTGAGGAAAFVAAAWELSDRTGAPLADAVAQGAARVRHTRARRGRVTALTAGSRATVTLLTALPLTGPVLGAVYGVGPGELYLPEPLVTASVVAGLGLLVAGRLWCRRLVAAEQVTS